MERIAQMLEKALQENRISRRDWEIVLELATDAEEAVLQRENFELARLIGLLEGGEVSVEGVSQREILRHLAVFI